MVEDVRKQACDILLPVYRDTDRLDGYVVWKSHRTMRMMQLAPLKKPVGCMAS